MTPTINITPDISRADFNRMLNTLNISANDYLIHQDTLRIEAILSSSNNRYKLNFFENPGSDNPSEKKLNRNDVFAVTHISLGVAKYNPSSTPVNWSGVVYFNEDGNYFEGNNGESAALLTVWNGLLKLKTSTNDRVEDFKTNILRMVPERGYQKLASPQTADEHAMYGGNGGMDAKGFFKLTPNIILNGQQDNFAELVLGQGAKTGIEGTVDSAGDAVTTRNLLVFQAHGFLIHDAANPALRWDIF